MPLQYTPTKEQQAQARMQGEYDRLDIRAREADHRLNRSTSSAILGNRNNHSIPGTTGNINIARIDHKVTMNRIDRDRDRLDMKYGNDRYAQLNLSPKEREQMANIQHKYDQLSNREDQLRAEGQKEHTRGISTVLDQRRGIGRVAHQTNSNAERRDIRLEEIQREREKLDILHGGEPKHSAFSRSATEHRSQTISPSHELTTDRREVKEISLENLTKLSREMKQSEQLSEKEKINKLNGVGEGPTLNEQSFAQSETHKIGLRF